MPIIGAPRAKLAEFKALEQIEHLQHGDALPRRRDLPHVIATIIRACWLNPIAVMLGKVVERKVTASLLRIRDDPLRDISFVISISALLTKYAIGLASAGFLNTSPTAGAFPFG